MSTRVNIPLSAAESARFGLPEKEGTRESQERSGVIQAKVEEAVKKIE